MRWRLVIKEYGPELKYIKGERNIVADTLSCLDMSSHKSLNSKETYVAELFGLDSEDIPKGAFPLTYKKIMSEQKQDKDLLEKLKNPQNSNTTLKIKTYRGGGKSYSLITLYNKILFPSTLQLRTVHWYHTQLCHPGEKHMEETIRQHFTWKNLREHVKEVCQKCHTCQFAK
jgi:Integrase zinc binding domain